MRRRRRRYLCQTGHVDPRNRGASIEGVDIVRKRLGAANNDGVGISVLGPEYLGTFQFRALSNAIGVFHIRFADIENNFLMDGDGYAIIDTMTGGGIYIGCEVECAIDDHCDDSNPCTDDTCNNGTCVNTNDDTNTCTDGNDCTADFCLSGVCTSTNEAQNTACDDGLFCTKTDKCDGAGVCVGTGDPCKGQNPECCEETDTCGPLPCI